MTRRFRVKLGLLRVVEARRGHLRPAPAQRNPSLPSPARAGESARAAVGPASDLTVAGPGRLGPESCARSLALDSESDRDLTGKDSDHESYKAAWLGLRGIDNSGPRAEVWDHDARELEKSARVLADRRRAGLCPESLTEAIPWALEYSALLSRSLRVLLVYMYGGVLFERS